MNEDADDEEMGSLEGPLPLDVELFLIGVAVVLIIIGIALIASVVTALVYFIF